MKHVVTVALLQFSLVSHFQPLTYYSVTVRIGFVNLLSDQAVVIYNRPPALVSHDGFVAELRRVFDHPVQGDEAWTNQGSSSTANQRPSCRAEL